MTNITVLELKEYGIYKGFMEGIGYVYELNTGLWTINGKGLQAV